MSDNIEQLQPPKRLNYQEAARYLGASAPQVQRWTRQGRIAYTKLGLQVQFTREDLDEFVAAHRIEATR